MGAEGESTGSHLHFEVHKNSNTYGGQIDPLPWLRARGVDV
jgi:murein DD-endopeptidase MepM/ murein hydrolase activator NlpD